MDKNKNIEYHFCQPWLDAYGHPLGSTIKLFKLTETNNLCKVYCQGFSKLNELPFSNKIKKYKLIKFQKNIHFTTLIFFFKHLFDLFKRKGKKLIKVFYIDSSPLLLISFTLLFSPILKFLKVSSVSTVLLAKPEKLANNLIFNFLIGIVKYSFVNIKFFSRTKFINDVYKKKFVKNKKYFQVLPMIELTQAKEFKYKNKSTNNLISFGLFGQLRNGKSIMELVNYFSIRPEYELIIAGKSFTNEIANIKNNIPENISLIDKFLSMEELHFYANKVDYHLLLYSFPWDIRMESGNYYLALQHMKPVISYEKGWIGNQVKKNLNGFTIEDFSEFKSLLNNSNIISINNNNYNNMRLNSKNFIKENYPHKIVGELLSKL